MLLTRNSSCYNPFFLCKDSKESCILAEVHDIVFFDPEAQEVIASARWFGAGSNNDFQTVEFCEGVEPKRKVKSNLSEKVPFYISFKDSYKTWASIDLYIPVTLLKTWSTTMNIYKGVEFYGINEHYYNTATLTLKGRRKQYQLVNGEYVITLPKEMTEQNVTFDFGHRFEKTDFAKRCEKLSEKATKAGVKLDEYQMATLLKVFNITEKRAK